MKIYFSIIAILCFVFYLIAQENYYEPKIEFNIKENTIELYATVLNKGEIYSDLNYLFLAVKKGRNDNLSNKKQEGKFIAKQNQRLVLSQVQMNFELEDELKAYLFIRDENQNKLLTKDSLIINFNQKTLDNSLQERVLDQIEFKPEEFIIRGLVSDHTKTKVGRDFYDIFYSSYNLMNSKFPFLIEIQELPSQGRNSKVIVKAEEKIIYEFMLTPNEEMMRAMNAQLFQILFSYDRNRNIINIY